MPQPSTAVAKLLDTNRSSQFWFTVQAVFALLTCGIVLATFIVCGSASTVNPMAVSIPVAWVGLVLVIWTGVKRARAFEVERLAAPSNRSDPQSAPPAATTTPRP